MSKSERNYKFFNILRVKNERKSKKLNISMRPFWSKIKEKVKNQKKNKTTLAQGIA